MDTAALMSCVAGLRLYKPLGKNDGATICSCNQLSGAGMRPEHAVQPYRKNRLLQAVRWCSHNDLLPRMDLPLTMDLVF